MDRLRVLAELPDFEGTRYAVEHEIGRGGMGVVYVAEDKALKRAVAIKVLNSTLLSSSMDERMLREATVIAQLEHPGIVPVHDAGTLPDGRVFYVMKLVRGKSLAREIENLDSVQDRLRIFLKACEAVAFAHANGVVHRDLKPENIMLGPFGEVLVMDWGTAKILKHNTGARIVDGPSSAPSSVDTGHGVVIGTPAYMSPEQARGLDQIDERSDIYSLGAVLKFLLNPTQLEAPTLIEGDQSSQKRSPFGSGPKIPKAIRAICETAMASEPQRRYQTVKDLAADVSRFLDGEPVSAYRENFIEKSTRWLSRHRFLVLLVLAYLLMRILFLFVSWG